MGAVGVLPDQVIAMRDQQLSIPRPGETGQGFTGRDAGHGREGSVPAGRHENELGRGLLLHRSSMWPSPATDRELWWVRSLVIG